MARDKKDSKLELEAEENLEPDTDLDLNEENEEADEEEEVAAKPKAKKRSAPKKPRAKKAAKADADEELLTPMDENVDEAKPVRAPKAAKPTTKLVEVAENVDDVAPAAAARIAAPIAEEKPILPVSPRKLIVDDSVLELEAATLSMQTALDLGRPEEADEKPAGEARPWNTMKDVSQGLAQNLERISQTMQELPQKYSGALDKLLKAPTPRPALVTKLALGFSAVALLLSFLSLSMAQSARQQAIALQQQKAVAAAPVAVNERRSRREDVRPPVNDELTRLAKELARSSTAPLAAAGLPAAREAEAEVPKATTPKVEPKKEKKEVAKAEAKPARPAKAAPRKREPRERAQKAPIAPIVNSEPRRQPRVATPPSSGLQPDAARVKALNDLARTSRNRVSPSTFE